MKRSRKIQRDYTTGEAAKICRCSIWTIIKCVDEGIIQGYYLPASTHRRIPSENLFRYMKENNIPMGNFPEEDLSRSSLECRAKNK